MSEFDVPRVTVRRTIRLLAAENVLSPQRGQATFITGKPGTRRHLRVETTLAELVATYSADRSVHATERRHPAPKYYRSRLMAPDALQRTKGSTCTQRHRLCYVIGQSCFSDEQDPQ